MSQQTLRFSARSVLAALLALLSAGSACAGIHYVEEMNTRQIAALDKANTVVILPGGILEEHGPYLPSNTDGFVSQRMAQDVAEALVEHGRDVLMFPALVLGSGGANELAAKYPFPGTFAVRLNTLRAVYMDLADELGESGFKWVFVIHSHGAPNHNRILDQACDYFTETYGGRMTHITEFGLGLPAAEDPRRALTERARKEDAESGHAGIGETSLMLFLRPDLVDPKYLEAPSFTASFDRMIAVARQKDWPGYFGAPQFSTAQIGARLYRVDSARMVQQALKVLAEPPGKVPPHQGALRGVDEVAIERDNTIEQRQQAWLKKQGLD